MQVTAEAIQVFCKLPTHFSMLERHRNGCLEIAYLASAVITCPAEFISKRSLLLQQRGNAIGKLNLASRTWLDLFQVLKNFWRQDIAALPRPMSRAHFQVSAFPRYL